MKKLLITCVLLSISFFTFAAESYKAGDFVLRGGFTNVNPDGDKSSILLADADSTLTLTADDSTQLGLNFVYFFNKNWAIELLAATPFDHDIQIQDTQSVLGVDGTKLAESKQLPPTLSALYYFDTNIALKPYVGIGLNYTIFFDEQFEPGPESLGLTDLSLDSSFGYSVQVGADYLLNDKWHINASLRYIDINTEATFDVAGDNIGKSDVDIDPLVASFLIGYKF